MASLNHSASDAATAISSDLRPAHPLLRWLPAKFLPYALIARWDRPIGVWLMLLSGLWGLCMAAPGVPPLRLWLLFLIGGWAMRGAGCTINDLFDRKLDAQVARTADRPLAAGKISVKAGLFWLAAQASVGFAVLLQLPATAQAFGLAAIPLIAAYPLMKRITWWPQAWLGITFNWGFWIGAAVYTMPMAPPFYLIYVGAIAWTIAYDTIYAVQDRLDDAQVGIRSTARLFGTHAPVIVYGLYVLTLALWAFAGLWLPQAYWTGWLAAALCAFWLLRAWRPEDGLSARQAFIRNRYIGLALLIGILLCKQ